MEDFLTVQDFAKQLKLTPTAVYIAIQDGRVKSETIFDRVVVPRSELQRFKTRRRNGKFTKILKLA